MGVAGLWDILKPAATTRSLTHLAVTEGFEANPDGVRGFRIGIDASIWFFHAEYGKEGENPVLRTLFFRCATLMRAPFLPLFVFDGPRRPDIKRGKKINKTGHKLIPGMKAIVEAFGFEWRMAPAEAEAELAYLNRVGVIDGILSDDVDNFLFGAKTVIRNPSNNLSGNRNDPNVNAAGKQDKDHTKVYHSEDILNNPNIRLTRGGLILIGLMSGGDYEQDGLSRCGIVTAHGLAKCGFGDTLYVAATTLPRDALPGFLSNWRQELKHELQTNSQGHIGRKQMALAKSIPETFPNVDVLLAYTNPITSESLGKPLRNLEATWCKDPDVGRLAATCEMYFEWGYKEAIIKRFRTIIWHGIILRILRRSILTLDLPRANSQTTTPQKKENRRKPGTPSKLIAKHFSSMTLGKLRGYQTDSSGDSDDDDDERLMVKIHSSRNHVSTDCILEYRLEVNPSLLVRMAESGIQGTRQPEGANEWDEDGEDSDGGHVAKRQIDPQTHLRLWMPAVMLRLAEPCLVNDFEDALAKKQAKKTKGPPKPKAIKNKPDGNPSHSQGSPSKKTKLSAKPVVTTVPALVFGPETLPDKALPHFRDLTKPRQKSAPSKVYSQDLKSFFPVQKLPQTGEGGVRKPRGSKDASETLSSEPSLFRQSRPKDVFLSDSDDCTGSAPPIGSRTILSQRKQTSSQRTVDNPSNLTSTNTRPYFSPPSKVERTSPPAPRLDCSVLEVSSDSDIDVPIRPIGTVPPLLMARAKAQAKSTSSVLGKSNDIAKVTKPRAPLLADGDIIDLT